MQEENRCDEGEGEDRNDKWVSVELKRFCKPKPHNRHKDVDVECGAKVRIGIWTIQEQEKMRRKTHTLNPGQSSV